MRMRIIMIKIYYGVLENNLEEPGKQKQISNACKDIESKLGKRVEIFVHYG